MINRDDYHKTTASINVQLTEIELTKATSVTLTLTNITTMINASGASTLLCICEWEGDALLFIASRSSMGYSNDRSMNPCDLC